ncbi:hydantoinase B/oxoprolinase family protein [Halovivax gelatinilyticus]|uniref:hydantoinase B/oxoprolinase family protein n=1 Tax=Halovivax gelatinilyticus TaxID=2961597 RepID=UPI0020CA5214|nr:hydantoinase B/oxoprolinase family protein [Halovivax gelatinilyticus]
MTQTGPSSDLDAATVEVIRNYLTSAAAEMQRTLVRTAYNTVVYEILDFGISVYDREMRLIADSPGLALFLGANDGALERAIEHVGTDALEPGDVLMLNYPYWSGTHVLDMCLIAPVFYDDEIVGYTTCRAHWLDLGAKDPGYVLDSTDMHQEGLVFPGTKVYEAGEPDEEIIDLVRFNSRIPDKVIGDLHAQVSSLETGNRRLRELYETYGEDAVEAAIDAVIDHGERTAREAVEALPDGTWTGVDYADGVGRDPDDGIRVQADVTIDGGDFTVDLSGSADEVEEPLNIPRGMTETICKLCFKTVTTPDEDSNDGQYQPLSVVAPEGNVFNAQYPAPTFTVWTAITGIDVIYQALAKALPDRVPAASGGEPIGIQIYGEHPDTGEMFVEANNDAVGWGATRSQDGESALMHISETMVRNVPIEVFENKAPIRLNRLELRDDSGGEGERRGGLGTRRDYEFTEPSGALSILQRSRSPGWGLAGGGPGARNVIVVDADDPDGERLSILVDNDHLYDAEGGERYAGMMRGDFEPGETLSVRTGGGGGYGDPTERDPEAVREDVADGYVSREAARETYGVVVTAEGELDREATEKLRS